jgi:hypothetical protein
MEWIVSCDHHTQHTINQGFPEDYLSGPITPSAYNPVKTIAVKLKIRIVKMKMANTPRIL